MRGPILAAAALALLAVAVPGQDAAEPAPIDPYARGKHGPPLAGVLHKARPGWVLQKLTAPRHHANARMPEFNFTPDEALDVMAYLSSVQGPAPPARAWPVWADTPIDALADADFDAAMALAEQGKAVWGNARCSICHTAAGAGGDLTGGFVDLRVGGIDLQNAGDKLRRDWLYRWLEEPKDYWPQTLMPRFTLADGEIRALAEYLLRDDAFRAPSDAAPAADIELAARPDAARVERGRRLVTLGRCVVCHDVPGMATLLPEEPAPARPPPDTFAFVAWDRRCLTCHSIDGRGGTYAPDLSTEGSRLQRDWIAAFVAAPDMVRPLSQQMPKLGLDAREAALVADHMARVRRDPAIPAAIPGDAPDAAAVARGRAAFRARGCQACHADGDGPGGTVGPDLTAVADRMHPGALWFHLMHPHAVNENSAEPDHRLSDAEARDLAAWLATRTKRRTR